VELGDGRVIGGEILAGNGDEYRGVGREEGKCLMYLKA
jgi:hypothetical protein